MRVGFHWRLAEDSRRYTLTQRREKTVAEAVIQMDSRLTLWRILPVSPVTEIVNRIFRQSVRYGIRPMESDDWIIYVMINHTRPTAYHAGGRSANSLLPTIADISERQPRPITMWTTRSLTLSCEGSRDKFC